MTETFWEPGSYRDRENAVFYQDGAVYRALRADAMANWRRVAATSFYQRWTQENKLIGTAEDQALPPPSSEASRPWVGVLRHEAIPFISYPYEWSFGML